MRYLWFNSLIVNRCFDRMYCNYFQVVLKEDGKSMIVSDDDIRGNLKVSNMAVIDALLIIMFVTCEVQA